MVERPETRKLPVLVPGSASFKPVPCLDWNGALDKGRGRGPIQHLKTLAKRLGWHPKPGGWQSDDQYFTWHEADYKV
eukprot:3640459-Amphidinium_carterae.1